MLTLYRFIPAADNRLELPTFYSSVEDDLVGVVNVNGYHYHAEPILVHCRERYPWSGKTIWWIPGPNLFFTSSVHAERVFGVLFDRVPDYGQDILKIELTDIGDTYKHNLT